MVEADSSPGEVTRLLRRASAGDGSVVRRVDPVGVRRAPPACRDPSHAERQGHSLRPTDLVHETYLRMVVQAEARPRDRAHFFALASQAMRRILVDHARRHAAAKRPGVHGKVRLDEVAEISDGLERGAARN